jgi:molybdopterin molybdotransferase
MLRVEEALEVVAKAAGAPRARREVVPLSEAAGRVLREDVRLDHDVPPFDRATMDGFAVRSADADRAGAELAVVARVAAGGAWSGRLGAGQAVAIMTGAPLPDGADGVIQVEHTQPVAGAAGAESRVRLAHGVAAGANVARRAEQYARGAVVVAAGTLVHAGTVGVLAAAGRAHVEVAARPRVVVLGTGDELVPVDAVPGPAQIRDSNGHALVAQVARAGGVGEHRGPVRDDEAALRAAIEGALDAELVCLSGGVSMGDRDLVPSILAACGVEPLFHRWAVKPGGPLWFGRRGDTLVFGLPGNPAATFVGFELLAVPAIRTRLGLPFRPRDSMLVACLGALPPPIARRQFVPVSLGVAVDRPLVVATPVRSMGSGDPFALAAASALAVVAEQGAPSRAPEGLVEVIPLRGGWLG